MARGQRLTPSAAKCDSCRGDAEVVVIHLDSFNIECRCIPCHVTEVLSVFARANGVFQDAVLAGAEQGAEATG